jgi:hypothetical protein
MSGSPSRETIAMTAAHGLTDEIVATWDPQLPRPVRVLVPVQLDVLMVRQKGGAWADCGMLRPTTGTKDSPQGVHELLPGLFKELVDARERGAYLHWSLPKGLRAGQATKGSITFPAIPERWVVLRLSPGQARRAVRGWVLVADQEPAIVADLATWQEPGVNTALVNPLTALGHGDLGWIAYYDNVKNRLAFYDDLQDVRTGPIAYLVCGWYAAVQNDPLADASIQSLADFNAKLAALGWAIPDYQMQQAAASQRTRSNTFVAAGLSLRATDYASARVASRRPIGNDVTYEIPTGWWPTQTLYHGSCVGIGWPSFGWPGNEDGLLSGEFGGPPNPGDVNVMLGNTIAEAMAAIVAQANGAPDEAQVLEAFQLGVLSELNEPDGRARVDVQCHASTFGSLSGGVETVTVHQAASGPPPAAQPATMAPGPGVFADHAVRRPATPGPTMVKSELGEMRISRGQSNQSISETFTTATFGTVMQHLPTPETSSPAQDIQVTRPLPRLFFANDPVVLVEGAKRSVKWDDDRFSQDRTLPCRLTGFVVTASKCYEPSVVAPQGAPQSDRPIINGEDVLEGKINSGGIPPECDDLLAECALFDPGGAAMVAAAAQRQNSYYNSAVARIQGLPAAPPPNVATSTLVRNVMVEQTAWWVIRDPRIDPGPVVANTAFVGVLPAPISVSLPVFPWHPVHLDWTVEYIPDPGGFGDWQLGEIDYTTSAAPSGTPITFSGRAPVTAAATAIMADAVRTARDQLQRMGGTDPLPSNARVKYPTRSMAALLDYYAARVRSGNGGGNVIDELTDIAGQLDNIDVLTAGFSGLHTQLRAGFPPDGASAPQQGQTPSGFIPLRAGFLRIMRLRLVDSFGQFVDLAGSSNTSPADLKRIATTSAVATPNQPGIGALPPRFTAPARLWFRFLSADDDTVAADDNHSPVCGYLMPNHIDHGLEFFDSDGTNVGVVRGTDDDRRLVWEGAPGRPSSVGQDPRRALANPHAADLATSLLRWGEVDAGIVTRETVFSALLRAIDSTRWATDPFGHIGDEHLALLLGHPVVIVRAVLRLELREPIATIDAQTIPIRVRLGALTHWQDGLYAYFVDDDYTALHVADAAVANLARDFGPGRGFLQNIDNVAAYASGFASDSAAVPITHPFVDASGFVTVRPGQTVKLTMLVEPHTLIYATSGLLPRKNIGLRRVWVDDALKKLAPTFRFGPVLVDPKRIRMPIPTDIRGTWSWAHRSDAVDWSESGITNATQDALLNDDPPIAEEGWIRLSPP